MDFDLSDDQRQIKESVERLLADRYGDLKQREAYQAEPAGYSKAIWQEFADLGLLGIPFSEEHGGLGQGFVETMIVSEAFGKALAIEPYLATVVLGGGVLRHAASAAQQAKLIPDVVAGKLTLALAHQEQQARYNLADIATTAKADATGYVIDGEKLVVLGGDSADKIIVAARTGGARTDTAGIGLFLVDASVSGVTRKGYRTQDGARAADIADSSMNARRRTSRRRASA